MDPAKRLCLNRLEICLVTPSFAQDFHQSMLSNPWQIAHFRWEFRAAEDHAEKARAGRLRCVLCFVRWKVTPFAENRAS